MTSSQIDQVVVSIFLIFTRIPGEMIQFDPIWLSFFQMGWNHQLGKITLLRSFCCLLVSFFVLVISGNEFLDKFRSHL